MDRGVQVLFAATIRPNEHMAGDNCHHSEERFVDVDGRPVGTWWHLRQDNVDHNLGDGRIQLDLQWVSNAALAVEDKRSLIYLYIPRLRVSSFFTTPLTIDVFLRPGNSWM